MSDQHPTPPGPEPVPGAPASSQAPGQPWPVSGQHLQPEYLQQGAGTPLPAGSGGGAARKGLLVGGAVVGTLALAGAGAWAALSLAGGGPQPTEALPADTLGFVSVDLDPSAGQKIEAMKMVNKFPSLKDELGLDPSDDLREALFDEVFASGPCEDKTYADDVAPWIGSRAAVAAVPVAGGTPSPVVVLQVSDAGKADAGLSGLAECSSGDEMAFVVVGEWAVIAEDAETAGDVVDGAAQGSLADDADYQGWMDQVGDPGVLSMYVASDAGQAVADAIGDEAAMSAFDAGSSLADFKGMAGTVRFSNGALEMEAAGAVASTMAADGGAAGVLASTLPVDTAAAFAFSVPDGWLTTMADQVAESQGTTGQDLLDEASAETGLELPEDFETLTGDAITLSVGSDIDLDAISSSDDLDGLPLGLKVQGDADAIQQVLDKLTAQLGPAAQIVVTEAEGDVVAISPSKAYRGALLDDGGLGDTVAFADAVPQADDASMVAFVDFDAGGWLDQVAASDPAVGDDLEPLRSLGMSAWVDGDTTHVVFRLTTD